jgi:hypothetical protein
VIQNAVVRRKFQPPLQLMTHHDISRAAVAVLHKTGRREFIALTGGATLLLNVQG